MASWTFEFIAATLTTQDCPHATHEVLRSLRRYVQGHRSLLGYSTEWPSPAERVSDGGSRRHTHRVQDSTIRALGTAKDTPFTLIHGKDGHV